MIRSVRTKNLAAVLGSLIEEIDLFLKVIHLEFEFLDKLDFGNSQ